MKKIFLSLTMCCTALFSLHAGKKGKGSLFKNTTTSSAQQCNLRNITAPNKLPLQPRSQTTAHASHVNKFQNRLWQ